MTQKELEIYFHNRLFSYYEKSEAIAITSLVFEALFGIRKNVILTALQDPVSEEKLAVSNEILSRLLQNEPVQYVIGNTWFCGLKLLVNNHVLIPRPETEELAYQVAASIRKANANIIDIGTGSGCIALSLKKMLPQATITGIDISEAALEIARINANANSLAVNFHQLDILNFRLAKDFTDTYQKFDAIVSNPPYIGNNEKSSISKQVLNYEPHLALFVQDDDNLLFYRVIADFSHLFLVTGGLLFFEINQKAGVNVMELLIQKGFHDVQLLKDISGNQRFVSARLS